MPFSWKCFRSASVRIQSTPHCGQRIVRSPRISLTCSYRSPVRTPAATSAPSAPAPIRMGVADPAAPAGAGAAAGAAGSPPGVPGAGGGFG